MSARDPKVLPRVLVVDDDAMMRLLARETLEGVGFEVFEAADGESALRLLAGCDPDLVLLDVEMPGIDGFTVCERMRAIADAARLPIVMVTAMDDVASIDRAYDAGATDFIAKPINWPMLGYRARYVLRGAHTLRALRDAEARNAAMLRAIPDMIFRVDADGTYLDFQPGAQAAPLVPPEQFIGRRLPEFLPAPLAQRLIELVRAAIATGEMQATHYVLDEPGGARHYEARLVKVGADEVVAVVRDVTDECGGDACRREAGPRA